MAEMHAELVEMTGPVGPDNLRLPGAPAQLGAAAESLEALAQALDQAGTSLKAANPPNEQAGRTVRAISGVAQRTGLVLEHDVTRLRELGQAVTTEREALRDAQQDLLPELRQRWQLAREAFREAVAAINAESAARVERQREQQEERRRERERERDRDRDGRGGRDHRGDDRDDRDDREAHGERLEHVDINAMQLIRHIDDNQVEEHEPMFRRLFGTVFRDPGNGQPMLMESGGQLDAAMTEYRRTVRQVLEEYAGAVSRIESTDQEVAQRLPRADKAFISAQVVDPDRQQQPDHDAVSGVQTIRLLADELKEGARALNKVDAQLEDARLAMRAGRLLPHGERIGSNDGFKTDWTAHLEDLRQRLNQAHEAAGTVAEKLRALDEEGAAEVRRAGRADQD